MQTLYPALSTVYGFLGKLVHDPLFWFVLAALLNHLSRMKSAEEWEAWALRKPLLALGADLLRAVGADPKKIFAALTRYADRRAGKLPEDLWARLPVSDELKNLLKDPARRAELTNLLRETSISAPSAPPAPPTPPSTPIKPPSA